MQDRRKIDEMEAFNSSRQQFTKMVGQMQSESIAKMSHAEIEDLLTQEGHELMRRMMQDHLELRTTREKRVEIVDCADGAVRNHFRPDRGRSLETVFGTVRVTRMAYSQHGVQSINPLDQELNLPEDKYSHGLRKRLAEELAKNSFDDAVESIANTTGGKVPKRQAEQLAARTSQDFDKFYEQRKTREREDSDSLLAMSLDGKGIVMRQEDLREATRRAAEKKQQSKKRLGSGEKRNRKRMATVAAIYSVDEYHRSAEQIMGLKQVDPKHARPRPRNKRVWASVEKDPMLVAREVFEEALRRDPEQKRRWLMLVDGDPCQLDRIEACKEHYDVDVTVLLDFIHVIEYVWKAAYAFHPAGSTEAEDWVTERGVRILQGKSSDVAAGMRRSATLQGLKPSKRKAVDVCAEYLLNNRDYLLYDLYLDEGFPISTGVIEGACRHLVKDRMDLTGARWRLQSAEAVLRIRAIRSSGDMDEYWRFHQQQEFERNYASRFSTRPIGLAA